MSFFSYKGKKSAWKTWNSQSDNATKAFKAISCPLPSIPEDVVKDLGSFTVHMYDPLSMATNTDTTRKELFCSQNKPIHLIPPTSAALYQHILRAAYQAGQVWGRSYDMDDVTPSPKGWGWVEKGTMWTPLWSVLPNVWQTCQELAKCSCKTGCSSNRCKCKRSGLPCTLQCTSCKDMCTNNIIQKLVLLNIFILNYNKFLFIFILFFFLFCSLEDSED